MASAASGSVAAHGDAVRQRVGASGKRQDEEGRSPARDEPSALRLFEAGGHLGRREPRRGVDVEVHVQGAEQRHRDAGGVDLAGHAASEYGNAVDDLGEVLVAAPRQRAVLKPRR